MKSIKEVRDYLVKAIAQEQSYIDDFIGRKKATAVQLARADSAICALKMTLGALDEHKSAYPIAKEEIFPWSRSAAFCVTFSRVHKTGD